MSNVVKKITLALLQLPLIGSFFLLWNEVNREPYYALLITVLYEGLLFVVAFGSKVWAKIEDKAVEHTADWIWTAAVNFAPGFRKRYKERLIHEHHIFNVRGLGLIDAKAVNLDQVFVELRIDTTNPQRFNLDPIAKKELTGNYPIWDFLRLIDKRTNEATALAIVGAPGSGKTTLLQHIALTFAANKQHHYKIRALIPTLLFLRDHVKSINQEKPPPLGRLLQEHFSDNNLFPMLEPPARWFEKQLARGKCVVLLDGLDEIADLEQRKAVSAWVDNQIKNYPRCLFVITARPQGYRDAPLHRADVLEVQPFNAAQVRKFIESWYLAHELKDTEKQDLLIRQKVSREANDLLQRLHKLPSLNDLTANPLLLTMITMVHRYRGALPGSRIELYAEICEVLLGRWRQAKGMQDQLKASQKLVVLKPLAAYMMERKIRDIELKDAVSVIAAPLKRVGVSGKEAKSFLTDLQNSSGLVLEREVGEWSFVHLTFQEYLAAAHWLERSNSSVNWKELVNNSWWHEMLRLYAAQGDATPLVKACLEIDNAPALALAADCLDEAREIDPDVRRTAEDRVVANLESDDSASRKLAAEVHLSRRLKSLHRIDAEREIDLEYLTCAEYQLFLNDLYEQGQYHQPDHWKDSTFQTGEARKPISGIRVEDALSFCDWLTKRYGGNVRYRLPRKYEADQHPSPVPGLAAICRDGNTSTLVGLTEAEEEEILLHITGLSTLPFPSELELDPGLTADLDLDSSLAHTMSFNRSLDVAITLDRDLTRARRLSSDRIFNKARALTLARDIANSLYVDVQRVLDRVERRLSMHRSDYDQNISRNRSRYNELAYSRFTWRIRELEPALTLTCKPKKADNDQKLISIVDAIEQTQYAIASSLATSLLSNLPVNKTDDFYVFVTRIIELLKDIMAIDSAENELLARRLVRRYVARRLEYGYWDYKLTEGQGRLARLRNILRTGRRSHRREDANSILTIYWWLLIILAREEGKLRAWEAIRIVREQIIL